MQSVKEEDRCKCGDKAIKESTVAAPAEAVKPEGK